MQQNSNISISIPRFVELCINNFAGNIQLLPTDKDLVVEILVHDKDEVWLHVEEKRNDVGELLHWLLWRKDAWLIHYRNEQLDKRSSEIRKIAWEKNKRNIAKLVKAITRMTGCDELVANTMANNILNKKPSAAKNFDVELEK